MLARVKSYAKHCFLEETLASNLCTLITSLSPLSYFFVLFSNVFWFNHSKGDKKIK